MPRKLRETDRLGRITSFLYDAASELLGVTETDTANPAATTAWQFTFDAAGNVVKSRMAPGEIVQQPISWSGSLAAGDATIDWDNDGQAERYDLITNVNVQERQKRTGIILDDRPRGLGYGRSLTPNPAGAAAMTMPSRQIAERQKRQRGQASSAPTPPRPTQ